MSCNEKRERKKNSRRNERRLKNRIQYLKLTKRNEMTKIGKVKNK